VRHVKSLFLIVLGTLLVVVMVQNAKPIPFRFLNWTYEVSQLLLVVIVLVIGFLAGFITAWVPRRNRTPEEP
jgi:uncharacterized integral membrane protein